jgi:acyl-CoA thioesterase-1
MDMAGKIRRAARAAEVAGARRGAATVATLVAAIGCADGEHQPPAASADSAAPAAAAASAAPVVLFLGTSLTAGQGVGEDEAFPALIQQKIDSAGLGFRVVNAGVSGETSAGGLRRLEWLLRQPIAVLVLELGANDGLRGQDVDSLEANLQTIVDRTTAADPGVTIVIAGMEAPPNMGRDFTARFRAVFPKLARANHAALIPFLLAGVGGVRALNQADGIHPTAEGHRIIAETAWRVLEPVLQQRAATGR